MDESLRFIRVFLASTSLLLAGCNNKSSLPTKEVTLSGIRFVIPEAYGIQESTEAEAAAFFQFEGLPGEIRDGRISVLGKDYGPIKQGDTVTFHRDGTFHVNGQAPEATGLASNTVESNGVLFMIQGAIRNKSETQGGGVTFEDAAGRAFTVENGSVTIDGLTHGPYSDGWVVKVSEDATFTFYP